MENGHQSPKPGNLNRITVYDENGVGYDDNWLDEVSWWAGSTTFVFVVSIYPLQLKLIADILIGFDTYGWH